MTNKQRRAAKRKFPRVQHQRPAWSVYFKTTTLEQSAAIAAAAKKK